MITEIEPGLWHCETRKDVEEFERTHDTAGYVLAALETLHAAGCRLVQPSDGHEITSGFLISDSKVNE